MKVLNLGVCDIILGTNRLQEHSPMTVDWKTKTITIPLPQGVLILPRHDAESRECLVINNLHLQGMCNNTSWLTWFGFMQW